MRYFAVFSFLVGALVFGISCSRDKEENEENESATTGFSDADLAVLNQSLNLHKTPFNYARLNLPEHYLSSAVEEQDNSPDDNHITNMGATLGRVLFYDKNLSTNNTISCSSCHVQDKGFSDPRKFR